MYRRPPALWYGGTLRIVYPNTPQQASMAALELTGSAAHAYFVRHTIYTFAYTATIFTLVFRLCSLFDIVAGWDGKPALAFAQQQHQCSHPSPTRCRNQRLYITTIYPHRLPMTLADAWIGFNIGCTAGIVLLLRL